MSLLARLNYPVYHPLSVLEKNCVCLALWLILFLCLTSTFGVCCWCWEDFETIHISSRWRWRWRSLCVLCPWSCEHVDQNFLWPLTSWSFVETVDPSDLLEFSLAWSCLFPSWVDHLDSWVLIFFALMWTSLHTDHTPLSRVVRRKVGPVIWLGPCGFNSRHPQRTIRAFLVLPWAF